MKPWSAPNPAPTAIPMARAMAHRNGKSMPIPNEVSQLAMSSA